VFSIEYLHEDPQNAMLVNSKLTSMFIDENVISREQQVIGTIQLFETQIEETEKRLEEKDRAVREFRTQYLGELPEQLNTNMEMLRRYEDDLKSVKGSIREAQDTRILLQSQIAELKAQLGILETKSPEKKDKESPDRIRELSLYSQLSEKKALLSQARLKFTKNHPEIRRLLVEIEELEKKVSGIKVDDSRVDREFSVFASPETAKLTQQLTILYQGKRAKDLEIKNLRKQQQDLAGQIDLFRRKVANTPAREEKIKELVRDYENLRVYYEDLLAKKMSADLSKTMESRQQGEHFEVIDPPNVSEKPFKPNRMKILLLSLVFSIALGVGGSIGLEYRDDTIKSPGEFKETIDIPVLVSLPLVPTKKKRRERLIKKVMLIGGILLYFSAVFIFIIIYMDKIKLIVTGGN
jgi:polysaccharide chain length determinant protein (PEP-CTERM system associated)